MRDAKNYCVVGAKKCGKTTTVIKMMQKFNRPAIIISNSFDPSLNQFKSLDIEDLVNFDTFDNRIYRIDLLNQGKDKKDNEVITDLLDAILDNCHDCSILFDDAADIFNTNRNRYLLKILANTRHRSLDIFFNYHNIDQIINTFFTHINYLVLFPTGIRAINKIDRFMDHHRDMIQQANEFLYQKFLQYGEHYGQKTQGFHLMVQIS